ncbi:MAG: large-conductance mechanosensitive channel protein MscL [Deltaproteobacteria bacterium]|nr:large-conductance mechanosensitive channel protein MscL [Deltaproteobacteria bacterium]
MDIKKINVNVDVKKGLKILGEFKAFAMRGNVIDMAVGIIIGGAFGKIVSSVVSDIIMPPIGLLLGGMNFKDLKFVMKLAEVDAGGKIIKDAVTLNYGLFIQNTVDFIIIAFAIFLMVKLMVFMQKKEAVKPSAPPLPTKEQELLTEIRDILKSK